MAWRWSVKKARKQHAYKETSCHALKTGRKNRRSPEARTPLFDPFHLSFRTNTSYVSIASSFYPIKRMATYDTTIQQISTMWMKILVEGLSPFINRHLDEARGREDQGGWRHATFIWVRTGYDPVAELQKPLPPACTHASFEERCIENRDSRFSGGE